MTFVLTIAGAKGGIGKTTTASSLAALLAGKRRRVTLLDLDPQASATLGLGQTPSPDPWQEQARSLELPGVDPEHFEVIPAGRALALAGADRVWTLIERSAEGRDVLVVDCPPGLGPLTLSAIEAADLVLVPVAPNPLDLPGVRDVAAIVGRLDDPPTLRIVLAMVHPRRALNDDVRADLRATYPGALYPVEVPEDVRAAEAPSHGLPVTLYAPSSRAAQAYAQLARLIEKEIKQMAVKQ